MAQHINFISNLTIRQKSPLTSQLILQVYFGWVAVLTVVSVITWGIYLYKQQSLEKVESSVKGLQTQIDTYKKFIVQDENELETTEAQKQHKLDYTSGFYRHFHDLAQYVPHDTWLNEISISTFDNKIILKGKTLSNSGITALLEALNKASSFKTKKFDAIQIATPQKEQNITFVLSTDPINPVPKSKTTK